MLTSGTRSHPTKLPSCERKFEKSLSPGRYSGPLRPIQILMWLFTLIKNKVQTSHVAQVLHELGPHHMPNSPNSHRQSMKAFKTNSFVPLRNEFSVLQNIATKSPLDPCKQLLLRMHVALTTLGYDDKQGRDDSCKSLH